MRHRQHPQHQRTPPTHIAATPPSLHHHSTITASIQGNWWLQALVQYGPDGEVLLFHRVTGEIALNRGTPNVSARCGVGGEGGMVAAV